MKTSPDFGVSRTKANLGRLLVAQLVLFSAILSCGESYSGSVQGNSDTAPVESSETPPDSVEPIVSGSLAIEDDYPLNLVSTDLQVPETLPPVQANTPVALTIAVSVGLTSYAIECSDSYAQCQPSLGLQEQNECYFIADVKCRFFGDKGPTTFNYLLGKIDDQMNEVEASTKGKNVPCLDEEKNTDGYTFTEGDQRVVLPAFQRKSYNLNYPDLVDINNNPQPLDLGVEYKLSCISRYSGNSSEGWSAFGQEVESTSNKTIYYMADGNSSGIGGVTVIDSHKNIEYYGTVGEPGITSYSDITQSNVLMHLKSLVSGTLELSLTGVNVGPGCGMRMIVKDALLYAEANMNMSGKCLSSDSGHDASLANMKFCLNVNASDPVSELQTVCDAAGLNAMSFTIDMLNREVFEVTNIRHLFVDEPQGLTDLKSLEVRTKRMQPTSEALTPEAP